MALAVLGVALVLRLLALPMAPSLSNDILRYVWDGRVVLSGANPYRLAPEADELAPLRDTLWQEMDHKEVPTVYPPLALGVFAVAATTPVPLLALRVLLMLADLGLCALLLVLARELGRVAVAHHLVRLEPAGGDRKRRPGACRRAGGDGGGRGRPAGRL